MGAETKSPSFLTSAVGKMRRQGMGVLPYALGRFKTVRSIYSAQAHIFRGIQPTADAETIFPGHDPVKAAKAIRRDAVYLPVALPRSVVEQLKEIALTADLRSHGVTRPFQYADVNHASLADGSPIAMAAVADFDAHPLAASIAQDPVAIAAISSYLGYTPQRANSRLFWSFAGELTVEQRRARSQTVDYHFDVHGYNFAYAAYYLTDTDRESGAHVMVVGSHSDKPATWLFGSVRQSDQRVEAYYGKDRVLCIEGPAGTGFWQDSSCYHKALAPVTHDRLLFQVRYA